MLVSIAKEMKGRLALMDLNVDEDLLSPSKYHVQAIPAFILFKNGEVIEHLAGTNREKEIKKILKKVL